MALSFNRRFNVLRVIGRLMIAILSLYVGGTMLSAFGTAMNGTTSALYTGLTLIGWAVSASNQITATNGGAILSVLGIIAIAQVVFEFVNF